MVDWIANGESGSSVRAKLNGMGQYIQKSISAADFLSCATVPIELIPAPGANKAIGRVSFWFDFKFNSIVYVSSPSQLRIKYDGSGTNFLLQIVALTGAESVLATGFGAQEHTNSDARTLANNKALVMTTDNGTDPAIDPIDGNSTAVIRIFYDIIPLS